MHTLYPKLAIFNGTPAVFEIDAATAYRFDLGANQFDTRFIAFEYKIFMPRLAVFGNGFERSLIHIKRPFSKQLHILYTRHIG